jgi:hypothetical protein
MEQTEIEVALPTPVDLNMLRTYLIAQRMSLSVRVSEIETLLGFIATSDDLLVRVAKIEHFLGLNR